ncbi:MAG: sodium:proton antiporter [Bdellovibrionia bacterium]
MTLLMSLLIGALFGVGFFLMLRRTLFKVAMGIALIGHAVNLFILTVGGLTEGKSAIMGASETTLSAINADPLPQALILTAIVIGFGMQAFLVVLIRNANKYAGTTDIYALKEELE